MDRKQRQGQSGMTLLELAIGLALSVGIGFFFSTSYSSLARTQNYYSVRGEMTDMALYFLTLTDCSATFTAAVKTACTAKTEANNTYIDVKQKDGTVLISSAQTTNLANTYLVRAKCIDANGFWGIVLESYHQRYATNAQSLIAEQWKPLAGRVPLACP